MLGILFRSTKGTKAQASWDDTCRWTTGFAAALLPMPRRPQLAAPYGCWSLVRSQAKSNCVTKHCSKLLHQNGSRNNNTRTRTSFRSPKPRNFASPKSFAASWPIARRKGSCFSAWHLGIGRFAHFAHPLSKSNVACANSLDKVGGKLGGAEWRK